MKLKICGMKYADNIRDVAKLSPDYMGFIFYAQSKRYVGDDFVLPDISHEIKRVGIFVNDELENILSKVKKYKLDFVQLHGDESVEFCKKAKEKINIIKAFGIDEKFDFSILSQYEGYCDYFLFDTKSAEYGGSGRAFDKNILKNCQLSKPYFLSGGIDSSATEDLDPFAIDVNSKFESMAGFKDVNKLKILKDELSGK